MGSLAYILLSIICTAQAKTNEKDTTQDVQAALKIPTAIEIATIEVATAAQTAGNIVVEEITEKDEEEEEEDLLLNLEENEVLWKLMLDEMDKLEMTKNDGMPLVYMYIHGISLCRHMKQSLCLHAVEPDAWAT